MGRSDNVSFSKGKFAVIILVVVVGSVLFMNYGLPYIRNQVNLSQETDVDDTTTTTTAAPTTITLDPVDALDPSNTEDLVDALTYTWWSFDLTGLTDADINDMVWSDGTLDTNNDETLVPDTDTAYVCKINGTNICNKYVSTDSRLFPTLLDVVTLGVNTINIYNQTRDVSIKANSINTQTVNRTDYRDWEVTLTCLDASESVSAEETSVEGFCGYYDPTVGEYVWPMFEVVFNATASPSWVSYLNADYTIKTASGTSVFIQMDRILSGENVIDIRLGSAIGTSFEAVQFAINYGYPSVHTQWDICA